MKKFLSLSVGLISLCPPVTSHAHVKWFAAYDLTHPPLPPGAILNNEFLMLLLISVISIFAFFCIDRFLFQRNITFGILERATIRHEQSVTILRIAACVFFVSIFIYGVSGSGFYLTPELQCSYPAVLALQLLIAILLLTKRTTPVAGMGIMVLYALGMHDYGVFHMLDYMIFVGIACFFMLEARKNSNVPPLQYALLVSLTGVTLLWASVEKWGYPHWTFPLFERDPSLLLGLTPEFYMSLAGYVEFNVTFLMLVSMTVLTRIIALGLNFVFVLAIYKFGLVDAVGHMMIIAILLIVFLRGPAKSNYALALTEKGIVLDASLKTGFYLLALLVFFSGYYFFYFLTVG